jgi:hypothetical protein
MVIPPEISPEHIKAIDHFTDSVLEMLTRHFPSSFVDFPHQLHTDEVPDSVSA